MGEILGLNRSSVANLEAGAQRASLANVYTICDHFNLNLTDVLPTLEEVRKAERPPSKTTLELKDVPPKASGVPRKTTKERMSNGTD